MLFNESIMLAKVPPKRRDRRTSFRSIIAYVTREGEVPDGIEIFTNCISSKTASAEMRAVAARSTRVYDPVFHFVISWQAGERPTLEQAQEAGRAALEALGMLPDDHQYVFAIHFDTDNVHLHGIVNRVSWETGRAVHPGLSYLKLDRCMREIELHQGWKHDVGPFAVIERDGQKVIERDRTERGKTPERARDMEAFSGLESLVSYASDASKCDVLAVLNGPNVTWQDIHEAFAKHGLALRIKGQGLAIYIKDRDGLVPIKASSVHERFGKGKLEKRLGPYVEPIRAIRVSTPARTYVERETDAANITAESDTDHTSARAERCEARAQMRADLKRRYGEANTVQLRETDTVRRQLRDRQQRETRALYQRYRQVRERIRDSDLPSVERKAAYSICAFERARELENLREQQRTERTQLKRPMTYREWVEERARQGDEAAIAQLRGWAYTERRRQRQNLTSPDMRNRITALHVRDAGPVPPTRAKVMKHWQWRVDTKTGDVDYLREGVRQFTDEGPAVVFATVRPEQDAMLAGLLLARQKFGPQLQVVGDEDFRRKTVALVVRHGLDVTFEDPATETLRLALLRHQQHEQVKGAQPPEVPVQTHRTPTKKPECAPLPGPMQDGPDL